MQLCAAVNKISTDMWHCAVRLQQQQSLQNMNYTLLISHQICIVILFAKTDFICKHSNQFRRIESKSSVAQIQLAISSTCIFSFSHLLYTRHICGIFILLTIRAYRCMVGKANQSISISIDITIGVTFKFHYRYQYQR